MAGERNWVVTRHGSGNGGCRIVRIPLLCYADTGYMAESLALLKGWVFPPIRARQISPSPRLMRLSRMWETGTRIFYLVIYAHKNF